jgi:hypothetical protein
MATLTVIQDFHSLIWKFIIHVQGQKFCFQATSELVDQVGPKYLIWSQLDTLSIKLSAQEEYELMKYLPDKPADFVDVVSQVPAKVNNNFELSDASDELPGIHTEVQHPVDKRRYRLRDAIISLNDTHQWTREQIADWLDEISDPTGVTGPDLRFKIKEEV